MRLSRIYLDGPLAVGEPCTLPPERARYVARVLRLGAGDPLVLFDGTGVEYDAVVEAVDAHRVRVRPSAAREVERESPLRIHLGLGLSRGKRTDLALQKAVELGVARITPLALARSVVRLDTERAEARGAHWRGVAIDACEQCGRTRLPEIAPLTALDPWLSAQASGTAKAVLAPGAGTPLRALPEPGGGLALLIGPEGGLTEGELAAARAAGFAAVSLGPRVLRAETAAIAALAAVQLLWGDLGEGPSRGRQLGHV